ncbi:MAG TPA: hypothetical protein VGO47_07460, partial [Chlamydiales bacterium]|nr:hypothetical protein [Chlamydiales bacterium]
MDILEERLKQTPKKDSEKPKMSLNITVVFPIPIKDLRVDLVSNREPLFSSTIPTDRESIKSTCPLL